jgi:hypothetical protein
MHRHAQRRRRRVHRRLKHIQQQAARIDAHDPFLFAMMTRCVAGGVQVTPISWPAIISSVRTIAE